MGFICEYVVFHLTAATKGVRWGKRGKDEGIVVTQLVGIVYSKTKPNPNPTESQSNITRK